MTSYNEKCKGVKDWMDDIEGKIQKTKESYKCMLCGGYYDGSWEKQTISVRKTTDANKK